MATATKTKTKTKTSQAQGEPTNIPKETSTPHAARPDSSAAALEAPQTLTMMVRRLVVGSPELTDDSITTLALEECARQPWLFMELLRPLVRAEVVMHRRQQTARHERAVFTGEAADPIAARRVLALDPLYVPGRARVTWGNATIQDHLARIAYLEAQVEGTVAAIDRHRLAIAEIKAAGVSCLNELAIGNDDDLSQPIEAV